MFQKRATITISTNCQKTYEYLRTRYDSEIHKSVSLATKGYIPPIIHVSEVKNERLAYKVAGHDYLLGSLSNWEWGYELKVISDEITQVDIWYKWDLILAIFGIGTIGHQVANEMVETAMALDALARSD